MRRIVESKNNIGFSAFAFFSILLLLSLFFILISAGDKLNFADKYSAQEYQREIALNEFLSNLEKGSPAWRAYHIDYNFPNDIEVSNDIQEYILNNSKLPGYIKKALIEKVPIELMTIGELFLIDSTLAQTAIIVQPIKRPNMLQVGFPEYLYKSNRYISSGPVYWFKNGFLINFGIA